MGLLRRQKEHKNSIVWISLTDIDQLQEIDKQSKIKDQIIFKHSTRCGISRMVLSRFENKAMSETEATFYLLDLLKHRPISDKLAEKYQVRHESPQILMIRDGELIAHESHSDILSFEM